MKVNIKKAKIEISVEGCIDCGDRWSWGWFDAKEVPITIGTCTETVTIHRCGECEHKRNPLFVPRPELKNHNV